MKLLGKNKVNEKAIPKLKFAVKDFDFITLKQIKYKNIIVPKGYIFDGVTVKAPFTFLFSNKDLKQGIRASCIHDWLCQHKDQYTLTEATNILIDVWKHDGLENFKAFIVKLSVNIFQFFKGGWKKDESKSLKNRIIKLYTKIKQIFINLYIKLNTFLKKFVNF